MSRVSEFVGLLERRDGARALTAALNFDDRDTAEWHRLVRDHLSERQTHACLAEIPPFQLAAVTPWDIALVLLRRKG